MSKVRFDALDVTAMVAHLQRTCLGQRIVNVYDDPENTNTYWLKLEESKEFLLLDAGVRFHPTAQRGGTNASAMPSPFCSKLRKHLRGQRLDQIRQLQSDRVVLFGFGTTPCQAYLVLELYARGNLLLLHGESYQVQALLRSHVYNENDAATNTDGAVKVQVGHVYPVTYATTGTTEGEAATSVWTATETSGDTCLEWLQQQIIPSQQQKKKKKKKNTLLTVLLRPTAGVFHYGPALLEHCCRHAQLDPHAPLDERLPSAKDCASLATALREEGERRIRALKEQVGPGYILYRRRPAAAVGVEKPKDDPDALLHADKELVGFQPHLLLQHPSLDEDEDTEDKDPNRSSLAVLSYPSFGAAVEDFFRHLAAQKQRLRSVAAEENARQKLQKARKDQENRLTALREEQEILRRQATVVQEQAVEVEKALTVVHSALDSGMDWDQLKEVVRVEQESGNPIALLVHKLVLESDAIDMKLPTLDGDTEDGFLIVRVFLKESAHANANRLFEKYRASKEKSQKTIDAAAKALQAAEESALRQLEEAQKKVNRTATITKRKPAWFERFLWFITSDNYLVLAGRDAHQNELLVKRYLRPGDGYLHADVHGAASCVLRAKRRRTAHGQTKVVPLSERALAEAGNFTVCRSSAWSKKTVISAWWVEAHQVSKTAPTGEYLTLGSFMIRGKKNFLPRCQLEMGLAVLFRLGDDDSILRHQKERRDFALLDLEDSTQDEDDTLGDPEAVPKVSSSPKKEPLSNGEPDENGLSALTVSDEDIDTVEQQESSEEISIAEVDSAKDNTNNNSVGNDTQPPAKKRGLSVKDRKLIKKYGSLELARQTLAERESLEQVQEPKPESVPTVVPEKNKRGKKSKTKKAMRKYADQDDEDRELAMLALQGGEKSKKTKGSRPENQIVSEEQAQAAADTVALLKTDSSAVAARLQEDVQEMLANCVTVKNEGETVVRWDKLDAETLEQLMTLSPEAQLAAVTRLLSLKETTRVDNFSSSLNGIIRMVRKYGHENLTKNDASRTGGKGARKTRSEKEAEDAKWKKAMAAEGVVDGEDDETAPVDDTAELNKLTGKPLGDDAILGAVAVCAPYHTLSQYTYRVKLTPGNMKRGKAAKQCVELFLHDNNNKTVAQHERYKELIKRVADNDWMQTICADVKISTTGARKKVSNKKRGGHKKSK